MVKEPAQSHTAGVLWGQGLPHSPSFRAGSFSAHVMCFWEPRGYLKERSWRRGHLVSPCLGLSSRFLFWSLAFSQPPESYSSHSNWFLPGLTGTYRTAWPTSLLGLGSLVPRDLCPWTFPRRLPSRCVNFLSWLMIPTWQGVEDLFGPAPGPLSCGLVATPRWSFRCVFVHCVCTTACMWRSGHNFVEWVLCWCMGSDCTGFLGKFCYLLAVLPACGMALWSLLQVQRCVEILSRAKRPLLVLGSQALLPPTPANKLR